MSASTDPAAEAATLDEHDVREYLKENGDFLKKNPDLLDYLHISHASGSAVSLVEKQVSVLRERNVEMRRRLNTLTANARDNDALYERTRGLVLGLLEAQSRDALCATFNRSMAEDFDVEHASIVLFGDPSASTETCRIESHEHATAEIGTLLRSRKAMCGALRPEELAFLFPAAPSLGSAAVMPLYRDREMGFIAVGSADAQRYDSAMGTVFLHHLADVIVRLLPALDRAGL
ncbi:MAG: DUF484 family protein [Pseudomonadota bacterium]